MLAGENLHRMSEINIRKADAKNLVNINNVSIDHSLPAEQRFTEYINQMKNPYAFVCGDAKVKISFSNTGRTLDDTLVRYFSNLKNR